MLCIKNPVQDGGCKRNGCKRTQTETRWKFRDPQTEEESVQNVKEAVPKNTKCKTRWSYEYLKRKERTKLAAHWRPNLFGLVFSEV